LFVGQFPSAHAATKLFLVGFIAIPWPVAGSVLFTIGVQRALGEIGGYAGALVMSPGGALRALAATASAAPSVPVTAYITSQGTNSVTPIPVATDTPGHSSIPVGSNPVGVAITPDGKTAYVTNDVLRGTVTPIAVATNTPGRPIPVGGFPVGVAITPDGRTVYVANRGSNSVTPIPVATRIPGRPIPVGSHPVGIAITPDGITAYVTNELSGTVTPIAVATNTPGRPIPVGSDPAGVAITPDGETAYVTNFSNGTVTPIAVATNTPGRPIPVGSFPFGVAITPAPWVWSDAHECGSRDSTQSPHTAPAASGAAR
jgi:YVTN family beta-propeller protein